jgi:hypothetical protein
VEPDDARAPVAGDAHGAGVGRRDRAVSEVGELGFPGAPGTWMERSSPSPSTRNRHVPSRLIRFVVVVAAMMLCAVLPRRGFPMPPVYSRGARLSTAARRCDREPLDCPQGCRVWFHVVANVAPQQRPNARRAARPRSWEARLRAWSGRRKRPHAPESFSPSGTPGDPASYPNVAPMYRNTGKD